MKNLINFIITILILLTQISHAEAGNRFTSSYSCSDAVKTCASSGEKTVDGMKVYKACWEWSYSKTCNYPSANNCWPLQSKCYPVADRECLLRDNYGNCVNIKKEFSCKNWSSTSLIREKTKWDAEDKNRARQLVCKGLPCVDGNCVDKSYDMNGEMMDSAAKLYMISQAEPSKNGYSIFPGTHMHCTKKATDYSNCCKVGRGDLLNNWGHNIGAHCTRDEKQLLENRQKNLCVYVGKSEKTEIAGRTVKHHYCCFGNLLNKVIQEQSRKQLGLNFGSGGSADCRGLKLDEILSLDFNKMDLSEAYAELVKKIKLPNLGDIDSRVKGSLPNIKQGSGKEADINNKQSGVNNNSQSVMGDESDYNK